MISGAVYDTVLEDHPTMEADNLTCRCLYFHPCQQASGALSGHIPDNGRDLGCLLLLSRRREYESFSVKTE